MQAEVASGTPDPADDLSAPPSFYSYTFIIDHFNLESLTLSNLPSTFTHHNRHTTSQQDLPNTIHRR